MNQFGDERRQLLSGVYDPEKARLLLHIVRNFHPIILGVSYWHCFRPWQVPERKINDNFFLLAESGEISCSVNGEKKILRRGELMMAPEYQPHSFGLAQKCDRCSHFIIHALSENVTQINDFCNFAKPYMTLHHTDSSFMMLRRATALRNHSREAAAKIVMNWLLELVLDEAEKGDFKLQGAHSGDLRIHTALEFLKENFNQPIGVCDMAQSVGLGEVRFRDCFYQAMGVTPGCYLQRYRLIRAAGILARWNTPVSETAALCGFTRTAYFCTAFRKYFGRSPSDFRKYNLASNI